MQDQPQPAAQPPAQYPAVAVPEAAIATPAGSPPAPDTKTGILVRNGEAREVADSAVRWVEKHGPSIVGVILLIFGAWIVASWARSASRRALGRTKFDPTLGKFFSNMIRWAILTLAVVTCFNIFGVAATSFAAIIGAVTLAIGLGFQNSLSNLAAGVMLLVFRPFKVGDAVNVAGQSGSVNEIDLMVTELDTADGRRIIVPNGTIFNNIIENITHHPRRRVDVVIGVGYEADIDATRAVLERALLGVHPKLSDPAPEVGLDALAGSSVNWAVRVWTRREDYGATKQSLLRAVKMALDDAGISIPFPQMDVTLKATNSEGVFQVVTRSAASS